MIFVDTSAWFASVVEEDHNSSSAVSWMQSNETPLITSDFVVDETLTLLRVRGQEDKAQRLGRDFFERCFVPIVPVNADDLVESWRLFRDFADKGWSFTDCSSKVVMDRLRIDSAFAYDKHFRQFASVRVVPD